MSTVKLLNVWKNRNLNRSCFDRCVLWNTRINDYEATRGLVTDSEKETGRKKGLRAADIAERLRREKEQNKDTTNKVSSINLTLFFDIILILF